MAGGSGTRFWPMSRQQSPKQFLSLLGDRTLIQQAYDRIVGLVGSERVWVLTGESHAAVAKEQLPELSGNRIIGEPMGRDTAPCIALAAALLLEVDPDARMIVLSADHLIGPDSEFQRAVSAADALLAQHPKGLVTFGIPPTYPATGYGYLCRTKTPLPLDGVKAYPLECFREKPDLESAKEFLAAGNYYWNAGIFCWRADTVLAEIEKNVPEMAARARTIAKAWDTPAIADLFPKEFAAMPKISIDYAVMEKAKEIYMVEAPFRWDDVGSWLALERVREADENRNVAMGLHEGLDSTDCVVVAPDGHLIATLGVKDLIVVNAGDVTLVASKEREQDVKKLLERLRERGHHGRL